MPWVKSKTRMFSNIWDMGIFRDRTRIRHGHTRKVREQARLDQVVAGVISLQPALFSVSRISIVYLM